MLTVERVLSTTSEKSQYFDAPEMFLPSDDDKGSSSHRPLIPHSPDDPQEPNSDIMDTKGQNANSNRPARRTPSLDSLPTWAGSRDEHVPLAGGMVGERNARLGRKCSVRTARSTKSATAATAAFQNGAALTGPKAEPDIDVDVIRRGALAERSLSTKQKHKIEKEEKQDSKYLSKLLKTESNLEKAALARALKTLAALQELYKSACKREEKAETAHCKSLLAAQKAESVYYEAKARAEEERA
ncbi:hypothetical protein M405DRAFT_938604, partial [Rhizopogon salebrosus TDB-379]